MKAQIHVGRKGDTHQKILFIDSNGDVSEMTVSDIEVVVDEDLCLQYLSIRQLICAYKVARYFEDGFKKLFNLTVTLNDY
jgi:hypothetical protein